MFDRIRKLALGLTYTLGFTPKLSAAIHTDHPTLNEIAEALAANEADLEINIRSIQHRRGLRQFDINGVDVWARDRTNAERKAKARS